MKDSILITGCCGFIGFNLSRFFLSKNYKVYGLDNFIDNYSIDFKKNRLKKLYKNKKFIFFEEDVKNILKLKSEIKDSSTIFHLAAQAGVRESQLYPLKYHQNNIESTYELIRFIDNSNITNVFFASSSSVYGKSRNFQEDRISLPLSFYASTKQYNESMFKYFLTNRKIVCMRFFSVFGEECRPDMAVYKFINSIYNNETVYLNNKGKDKRDYTYIKDLIELIYLSYLKMDSKDHFFKVLNYGLGNSYSTSDLLNVIKKNINKNFNKIVLTEKNIYDVDVTKSNYKNLLNFLEINSISDLPNTSLENAIQETVEWFLKYEK